MTTAQALALADKWDQRAREILAKEAAGADDRLAYSLAGALNSCAAELRRALADDAGPKRCDGCGQAPCRWSVPCGTRAKRRSGRA